MFRCHTREWRHRQLLVVRADVWVDERRYALAHTEPEYGKSPFEPSATRCYWPDNIPCVIL